MDFKARPVYVVPVHRCQYEIDATVSGVHLDIPTGVKLTSYSGEASDLTAPQFDDYLAQVAAGKVSVKLGPVFEFDDLQQAHAHMDANRANGKMVIVVP